MDKDKKVLVLGAADVGKSALIVQFINHKFREGEKEENDSYRKQLEVEGEQFMIEIIEASDVSQDLDIKVCDGFVFVYAVDSRSSFEDITNLHDKITQIKDSSVPMVLCAAKTDLKQEVKQEEGQQLARKLNCSFFETSAKTGDNVAEAFSGVVAKIKHQRSAVGYGPPPQRGRKRCCIC